MDITPLIPEGRQIIQGYGASGFKVNGKTYEGAIIVTPTQTQEWEAQAFAKVPGETEFIPLPPRRP